MLGESCKAEGNHLCGLFQGDVKQQEQFTTFSFKLKLEVVCVSSPAWHRVLQSMCHAQRADAFSSIPHEEVLAEQCRTIGSLGNNFIGEAKKGTAAELILLCCAVPILRAREDFAL